MLFFDLKLLDNDFSHEPTREPITYDKEPTTYDREPTTYDREPTKHTKDQPPQSLPITDIIGIGNINLDDNEDLANIVNQTLMNFNDINNFDDLNSFNDLDRMLDEFNSF